MTRAKSQSEPDMALWRVVFDSNVFVAASLSKNPKSPNKELLLRWKQGEFSLLVSESIYKELIEKLILKGTDRVLILQLVTDLIALAEWIDVEPGKIKILITDDPEDNHVIACAIQGNADYLVTYDPDFSVLGNVYEGVKIIEPLAFLSMLRRRYINSHK